MKNAMKAIKIFIKMKLLQMALKEQIDYFLEFFRQILFIQKTLR